MLIQTNRQKLIRDVKGRVVEQDLVYLKHCRSQSDNYNRCTNVLCIRSHVPKSG